MKHLANYAHFSWPPSSVGSTTKKVNCVNLHLGSSSIKQGANYLASSNTGFHKEAIDVKVLCKLCRDLQI